MFSSKKQINLKDYFETLINEILYNPERYPDAATISEHAGFSEQEITNITIEQQNLAFVYLLFITKELQRAGKIKSVPSRTPQEQANHAIGEAFGFSLVVSIFKHTPKNIPQDVAADTAEQIGGQRLAQYSDYLDKIEEQLGNEGDPYFLGFQRFKERTVKKSELTNEKDFSLLMLSKFIKNELVKDLVDQITQEYKIV